MAGRSSIIRGGDKKGIDTIKNKEAYEAIGKEIDFEKTAFVFVSIPHSEISTSEIQVDNISGSLVNLADMIHILQSSPFQTPDQNIYKFIYPDNSDLIYTALYEIVDRKGIENVFIFYQGFGAIKDSNLILLLNGNKFEKDSSRQFSLNRVSNILRKREKLNTILLIDASYAAMSFADFSARNYAMISSCGTNQHAYIRELKDESKTVSIFSYCLVNTFKDISNGEINQISVYDLYLHVRSKMIEQIQSGIKSSVIQNPEIVTKNSTPYLVIPGKAQRTKLKEEKLKNKYSFDHLKNLIGENKTKETLDILVKGIMFNNVEKNAMFLFKSRLKSQESSMILGLVTDKEYEAKKNKLNYSILQYIDELMSDYEAVVLE